MLSTKDITKLISAFKEFFVTKEEFQDFRIEMKEGISTLQRSVDNFGKTVHRHDQEITVMNHRIDKLEKK